MKQLIVLAVYKLYYLVFLFAEELRQFLEYIVVKLRIARVYCRQGVLLIYYYDLFQC